MLEQMSAHEAQATVQRASFPDAPVLSDARQAQIEAYLDHLCSSVATKRPENTREEIHAEMQARLEILIVVHQQFGRTLDEATAEALRELHRDYVNATQSQKTVILNDPTCRRASFTATLLPLSLFSGFYVADATEFAWRIWSHVFALEGNGTHAVIQDNTMLYSDGPSVIAFYRFELFAVPLLVGLITGLFLRQKACKSTLNALALLAVPAILIPGFFLGLNYAGIIGEVSWGHWIPSPISGIAGITFWAAFGCVGASLGAWIRKPGKRVPTSFQKAHAKP